METKKPWQSKTVWVSLIVALAAFVPVVKDWIAAHPDLFAQIVGGVFIALRFLTKGAIDIKDEAEPPVQG